MKGFSFYVTYWDVAQELETPEEQGEFYRAIADYMFAGEDREKELSWHARVCFKAIKPNLVTSKRRGQNAIKNKSKQNQKQIKTKSKSNQNEDKTESKIEQDKDKVKGKEEVIPSELITSSLLDGAADAVKTAPPSKKNQRPLCPDCEHPLWKNTQSGRWDCSHCFGSWTSEQVAS